MLSGQRSIHLFPASSHISPVFRGEPFVGVSMGGGDVGSIVGGGCVDSRVGG